MKPAVRPLLWGASLLALAAVFALYLQPDFVRLLADQTWSCL